MYFNLCYVRTDIAIGTGTSEKGLLVILKQSEQNKENYHQIITFWRNTYVYSAE